MEYRLDEFVKDVFRIARYKGYTIEVNRRNGLAQIDFGVKKLHLDHIEKLFPSVLSRDVKISELIDAVAPGRPCVHRPFREIVEQICRERSINKD